MIMKFFQFFLVAVLSTLAEAACDTDNCATGSTGLPLVSSEALQNDITTEGYVDMAM